MRNIRRCRDNNLSRAARRRGWLALCGVALLALSLSGLSPCALRRASAQSLATTTRTPLQCERSPIGALRHHAAQTLLAAKNETASPDSLPLCATLPPSGSEPQLSNTSFLTDSPSPQPRPVRDAARRGRAPPLAA